MYIKMPEASGGGLFYSQPYTPAIEIEFNYFLLNPIYPKHLQHCHDSRKQYIRVNHHAGSVLNDRSPAILPRQTKVVLPVFKHVLYRRIENLIGLRHNRSREGPPFI